MNRQSAKTILLVEDEALIAMMEKKQLEQEQYRVIHVLSGEKAIDMVCNSDEQIDIILMDIDLGRGLDGTQTAKRILEHHDIPILFVSSHVEKELVEKTEKITNYGYVVKNSSFTVLYASIKMAFKLYEAHRKIETHLRMIEDVQEVSRIGFWYLTTPSMKLEWTEGLMLIFGLPRSGKIPTYEEFWTYVHPDDIEFVKQQATFQLDTVTDSVFKYEYRIVLKDGSIKHLEHLGRQLRNSAGKLIRLHGSVQDITERRVAQQALQKISETHNILIDASSDPMFSFASDGKYLYVNKAFADGVGKKVDDIIGKDIWSVFPKDEAEKRYSALKEVFRSGEEKIIEVRVPRPDGDQFYLTTITSVKDEKGNIPLVICSSKNITMRKKAEESVRTLLTEKDLLLREVHHRMKNNMNILAALLRLESDNLQDSEVKSRLQDAASRVQSMVVLYGKLFQSEVYGQIPLKDYLLSLLEEVVGVFQNEDLVKVEVDIEDFSLDAKLISTLGLIINEMTTNSMKYAFKAHRGVISVKASRKNGQVIIEYADNGVGLPEGINFEKPAGFGTQLIKMLIDQIHGTINIERGSGTKYILSFEPS